MLLSRLLGALWSATSKPQARYSTAAGPPSAVKLGRERFVYVWLIVGSVGQDPVVEHHVGRLGHAARVVHVSRVNELPAEPTCDSPRWNCKDFSATMSV